MRGRATDRGRDRSPICWTIPQMAPMIRSWELPLGSQYGGRSPTPGPPSGAHTGRRAAGRGPPPVPQCQAQRQLLFRGWALSCPCGTGSSSKAHVLLCDTSSSYFCVSHRRAFPCSLCTDLELTQSSSLYFVFLEEYMLSVFLCL